MSYRSGCCCREAPAVLNAALLRREYLAAEAKAVEGEQRLVSANW